MTPAAVLVAQGDNEELCADLGAPALQERLAENAAARYVTLRFYNGVAPGPLLLHFYDLGPTRGLRLVAIERPTN